MNRFKNPSLWIGFGIAALALVTTGAFGPVPERATQILTGTSQLLGLVGAWFFGAGLKPAKVRE